MKKYTVSRKEVYTSFVVIEADSEQEAIEKVAEGEGEEYGEIEYSHTLDPDLWYAEDYEYNPHLYSNNK